MPAPVDPGTPRYLADKRWTRRCERWSRPGRALFTPAGYGVEVIPERDARALIIAHHYSGSFPAARLSVGLRHKSGPCARPELVGVAVFSVPMNQRALTAHAEVRPDEGVELGRFVCLSSVAYNGETWFLTRSFQALRAEKTAIRAVLSYADPLERATADGMLCKPAHAGTIYQAGNAAYVGRASARQMWLTRDGKIVSPRALSKIRAQDQGHRYAELQLVAAGAEPRAFGEDPSVWLERVLRAPTFRRVRHPGNLAYVFAFDRSVRSAVHAKARPYLRPHELAEAA